MYLRYAEVGEKHTKSGSKRNLQIIRTTVVSAIALIVARANAVLFSQIDDALGPHNGQQHRPISRL